MSSDIRIRKGLDIQLEGKAEAITKVAPLSQVYGLRPAEFHRVIPKLIAREGATVKAGDPVFYDKRDERGVYSLLPLVVLLRKLSVENVVKFWKSELLPMLSSLFMNMKRSK